MSTITQNEFEKQVLDCFRKHTNTLSLCEPTFSRDGHVITATMTAGATGKVEIRCGPAEYATEIFVFTSADKKRWSLADLLKNVQVRSWMDQNRPRLPAGSRLEAEIAFAFSLLDEGLRDIPEIRWLSRKA